MNRTTLSLALAWGAIAILSFLSLSLERRVAVLETKLDLQQRVAALENATQQVVSWVNAQVAK